MDILNHIVKEVPFGLKHGQNFKVYPKGYCVYFILNKINNLFYIGSTKDIRKRIKIHLQDLRQNEHTCKKLQDDYDKFGKEVFNIYILEFCNQEVLLDREQCWLDKYLPHINGYNFSSTAISGKGYKRTEEHKNKISKALIGRKLSEEHRIKCGNGRRGKFGYDSTNNKVISQYDLNMNYINTFGSIRDAARKTNSLSTAINNNLKGRTKSSNGFIWKYTNKEVING